MKPRSKPPTATTTLDETLAFRIWAEQPTFQEDKKPWKCLAAFWFLGDALEFIADCQDKGVPVVFQSPAHTNLVRPTDARAVYKQLA